MLQNVAEGVRFELTAPERVTGFQDRLLKPLGHPSGWLALCNVYIIPHFPEFVKGFLKISQIFFRFFEVRGVGFDFLKIDRLGLIPSGRTFGRLLLERFALGAFCSWSVLLLERFALGVFVLPMGRRCAGFGPCVCVSIRCYFLAKALVLSALRQKHRSAASDLGVRTPAKSLRISLKSRQKALLLDQGGLLSSPQARYPNGAPNCPRAAISRANAL